MNLITTQRASLPWRQVILLALVAQAHGFVLLASGNLTFTLRKYIESPGLISSISSLDVLFNLLVAAPCLYFSDRIWTRFGRRLPFVLTAWSVLAVTLFLLPLASGAVPVVVFVVLWLVFWDVASTFEALQMEIIPPHQRGRATAIGTWFWSTATTFQFVVINGRFDDMLDIGGVSFSGEQIVYWFGALCLVFALVFTALYVRERPPPVPATPEPDGPGGLRGMFRNIFGQRLLWPVYLLVFSITLIETGLGPIGALLTTEQWAYSKQDLGTNVLVGGLINMAVVIPVLGFFADRVSRLKLFGIGVVGVFLAKAGYYVFVQFGLPDQRPSIVQMIIFGQLLSTFSQVTAIAGKPLLFDYIPRAFMGTAQAGFNFVRSITRLLLLNGIGLWVTFYAWLFLPPGRNDYFSGYLFLIGMNAIGLLLFANFVRRVREGSVRPLGREGYEPARDPAPPAPAASPSGHA